MSRPKINGKVYLVGTSDYSEDKKLATFDSEELAEEYVISCVEKLVDEKFVEDNGNFFKKNTTYVFKDGSLLENYTDFYVISFELNQMPHNPTFK